MLRDSLTDTCENWEKSTVKTQVQKHLNASSKLISPQYDSTKEEI